QRDRQVQARAEQKSHERQEADLAREVEPAVTEGDGQGVQEGDAEKAEERGGEVEGANPAAGAGELLLGYGFVFARGRQLRLALFGDHRSSSVRCLGPLGLSRRRTPGSGRPAPTKRSLLKLYPYFLVPQLNGKGGECSFRVRLRTQRSARG